MYVKYIFYHCNAILLKQLQIHNLLRTYNDQVAEEGCGRGCISIHDWPDHVRYIHDW